MARLTSWFPRGGRSLIERVHQDARIPVIGHLEGLCHIYVHKDADAVKATEITLNAKMRRTAICGAAETVLIDADVASRLLPGISAALISAGCELRGDLGACDIVDQMVPATDADWITEYVAPVLSVRIVSGVDDAIEHIARYGSGHTESIITENNSVAEHFLNTVDSSIVMHNASTQFADGASLAWC